MMKEYRADLHIHSVLSPCGDTDMSPARIVDEARKKELDIIGITDHNSTRQVKLVYEIGLENDILVIPGAEVTSREEIHNLVFFENFNDLQSFQSYLDLHLRKVKNNPRLLGYQLVVDREEMVEYEEEWSLAAALDVSIEELAGKVHSLNGLFIPAHIDRFVTSIYSQLGVFPTGLEADALEVSWRSNPVEFAQRHPEINDYPLVTNSDAHFPDDIGRVYNVIRMKEKSFCEIRMALKGIDGRQVIQGKGSRDHAITGSGG